MHPTPVTLCIIGDLFQFLLAQIAVLWCISAPAIALFTCFSLVQLYSVLPKAVSGLKNWRERFIRLWPGRLDVASQQLAQWR